jgi:hypothetical protein
MILEGNDFNKVMEQNSLAAICQAMVSVSEEKWHPRSCERH